MPEPIDPRLAQALDTFTVPDLPPGFIDRLVERAGETPAAPPLPRLRAPSTRRWLRLGATTLGTVALGVVSISAAAMGYLGEPISSAIHRAPVIGRVIERVIPERHALHRSRGPHMIASQGAAAPVSPPEPVEATPVAHPIARRILLHLREMPPEARREWLESHPRAAARIAERRAARQVAREAGLAPSDGPDGSNLQRPLIDETLRERRERRREWLRERVLDRALSGY